MGTRYSTVWNPGFVLFLFLASSYLVAIITSPFELLCWVSSLSLDSNHFNIPAALGERCFPKPHTDQGFNKNLCSVALGSSLPCSLSTSIPYYLRVTKSQEATWPVGFTTNSWEVFTKGVNSDSLTSHYYLLSMFGRYKYWFIPLDLFSSPKHRTYTSSPGEWEDQKCQSERYFRGGGVGGVPVSFDVKKLNCI